MQGTDESTVGNENDLMRFWESGWSLRGYPSLLEFEVSKWRLTQMLRFAYKAHFSGNSPGPNQIAGR